MKIPNLSSILSILKTHKKIALIIGGAIFVVALGGLYNVYSGKADEQRALKKQLTEARTRLSAVKLEPLQARQAELEKRLSEATPQMEAARAKLSQPGGSVNVTTILFALAKDYDVVVTEMTSKGLTMENLEGVTYSVLPLTAKVEGKLDNLVGFTTKLNSYYTMGAIKSTNMMVTVRWWQFTLVSEVARELLSQPEGFSTVNAWLLGLARTYGVNVSGVTATENLDGVTFTVMSSTPEVFNVDAFTTDLKSFFVPTVLKTVTSDNASADIQWTVYSYQGD